MSLEKDSSVSTIPPIVKEEGQPVSVEKRVTSSRNPNWLTITHKRKVPRDLAKLARTYTVEATLQIVNEMRFGEKSSDRLKAADMLLDRGYGKAPQKIELTPADEDENKKSAFQVMFEAAAKRAHESLMARPENPPPVLTEQQVLVPEMSQEKSQLSDKGKLALEAAREAGITVIEDALPEES